VSENLDLRGEMTIVKTILTGPYVMHTKSLYAYTYIPERVVFKKFEIYIFF